MTIGAISDATTSLNEAIDVMGLRNVHEDPPVLNGKDIKGMSSRTSVTLPSSLPP